MYVCWEDNVQDVFFIDIIVSEKDKLGEPSVTVMSHDIIYLDRLTEQLFPGTAEFSMIFPWKHDERPFSSGNSVSVVPKVTLIIVYWSNNSVRLSRIQGIETTMSWTKHTDTVGRNQLWLKIVILEVIKGKLDMLRRNTRW